MGLEAEKIWKFIEHVHWNLMIKAVALTKHLNKKVSDVCYCSRPRTEGAEVEWRSTEASKSIKLPGKCLRCQVCHGAIKILVAHGWHWCVDAKTCAIIMCCMCERAVSVVTIESSTFFKKRKLKICCVWIVVTYIVNSLMCECVLNVVTIQSSIFSKKENWKICCDLIVVPCRAESMWEKACVVRA
jgi:hypothetical protein